MSKYSFLILTDHTTHSENDSLFDIVVETLRDRRTNDVYVCSRGVEKNQDFFAGKDDFRLFAFKADQNYSVTSQTHLLKKVTEIQSSDFDVVLIRIDRPVTDKFLVWLDHTFSDKLLLNKPASIIETGSKEFLLNYPDLVPGIKLMRDIQEVRLEVEKYPIVLKPLKGYGGKGLIKLTKDGAAFEDKECGFEESMTRIKETLKKDVLISMKFLKNVINGDKRILVVKGQVLGAVLRKPKEGSWLCNVSHGGSSFDTDIMEEEYRITALVNKDLEDRGVLIYGIDTLEDDEGKRVLSEINTLNVGGFLQASRKHNNIYKTTISLMFTYIEENQVVSEVIGGHRYNRR